MMLKFKTFRIQSLAKSSIFFKISFIVICVICLVYQILDSFNNSYSRFQDSLCEHDFVRSEFVLKQNCSKRIIVTTYQGGRLGNQIWEYISVWLVAKHIRLEPFVPGCMKWRLSHIFDNLTVPSMEEIAHCSATPTVSIEYIEDYDLNSNISIILSKFNMQPELLSIYYKEVIKELSFKKSLIDKSQKVLHSAAIHLKNNNPTFISVHVRRTDYVRFVEDIYGGKPATINFYISAINFMKTKYPNSIFIMVSDDPEWCAEQFKSVTDLYITGQYYKDSSAEQDLSILASCNHSIFDYGTYGQWGAIFAGGETIFYSVNEGYLTEKISKFMPNWHTL